MWRVSAREKRSSPKAYSAMTAHLIACLRRQAAGSRAMLDGQQKVEIDPKSAGINLDKDVSLLPNKNDLYGNIITIKGADGKCYAFDADYKEGWFDVSKFEGSTDIANPTHVDIIASNDGAIKRRSRRCWSARLTGLCTSSTT
ncbi:MAG: hypothetical protein Q8N45_00975 [Anaerolineales bacterium]|nr:hypothetical protein [Anaerolineales bacterium]